MTPMSLERSVNSRSDNNTMNMSILDEQSDLEAIVRYFSKNIVDNEYKWFCGVFEKVTKVFYVSDILEKLLDDESLRSSLVRQSCTAENCDFLIDEMMAQDSKTIARELIEGFPYRPGKDPERIAQRRFTLRPLYNLFFTRDASSS